MPWTLCVLFFSCMHMCHSGYCAICVSFSFHTNHTRKHTHTNTQWAVISVCEGLTLLPLSGRQKDPPRCYPTSTHRLLKHYTIHARCVFNVPLGPLSPNNQSWRTPSVGGLTHCLFPNIELIRTHLIPFGRKSFPLSPPIPKPLTHSYE